MGGNKPTYTKITPWAQTEEIVKYRFPVESEPPIPTLDKPLIIESACSGWQIGGQRFPAIPISIEDQISEQVESVKAGAAIVHVHPRNPQTGLSVQDHPLMARILDGIFQKVGDCITSTHSWYPVPNADYDCITGTQELLELGKGNKYVQASLMVPIGYRTVENASYASADATIEGIKWMEANNVKPFYQLFDTYSHLAFKRFLFDQGSSMWKPFVMNIQIGKHEAHASNQDPWSHLQLITSMNVVKNNVPDSAIGVYPGGRNWLPLTTLGIILGADIVRVGVEDAYWMYPHKNEIIKKHSDIVKMTVDLAEMHGRRVVKNPAEARSILGMKLT
jgi:3-keto-5-aminohexanoate cleavage enzyme